MIKCVNNFNTGVRHDMKLVVQNSKNAKFWHNKNTLYIKALTLSEFKTFLGLLIASICCTETGINLWKSYHPQDHYFNSAPDFERFMTFSRFYKIRNFRQNVFQNVFQIHPVKPMTLGGKLLEELTNSIESEKNYSKRTYCCA